jgi:hypothetical protein
VAQVIRVSKPWLQTPVPPKKKKAKEHLREMSQLWKYQNAVFLEQKRGML